jgi:hypothetical protein
MGYDSENKELEIEFHSPPGAVYRYHGVPELVWEGHYLADSAGKWFDSNIKGKFSTERIS